MPNIESGRFDLLQNHEKRLTKVETDLWVGNGKPGLTTRMALMEETVTKINKNLSKIVWLLVATLLSIFVKLFVFKG